MNFEYAIEHVLKYEGSKLTNDKSDHGGLTKFGISSRAHPDIDIETLTREAAIEIYRVQYWDKYEFDKVPVEIRLPLFDTTVNMGHKNAVICLQRAINCVTNADIEEDGIFGKETENELKSLLDNWGYTYGLIHSFKSERAAYYRVLAARDPSQEKFLKGWLKRAYC